MRLREQSGNIRNNARWICPQELANRWLTLKRKVRSIAIDVDKEAASEADGSRELHFEVGRMPALPFAAFAIRRVHSLPLRIAATIRSVISTCVCYFVSDNAVYCDVTFC